MRPRVDIPQRTPLEPIRAIPLRPINSFNGSAQRTAEEVVGHVSNVLPLRFAGIPAAPSYLYDHIPVHKGIVPELRCVTCLRRGRVGFRYEE